MHMKMTYYDNGSYHFHIVQLLAKMHSRVVVLIMGPHLTIDYNYNTSYTYIRISA